MSVILRPYQGSGVTAIRGSLKAGKRAPLYVLPTGGGKTVTYAVIAQGAASKGNNVLILEHRKELIRQASVALARLGVRHRIIAPPDKIAAIRKAHIKAVGWPMIDQAANVAVASVQTLGRRMDWLKLFAPRIIIIDEAHHAVAGTWARIIEQCREVCPDAILIGVTATPCRTDGTGLGGVFDDLLLGPSPSDLIEDGYLVPYRVVVPPQLVDVSKVKRVGKDLDPNEQAKLLDKPHITGKAVEHYGEMAPGKPAIVCCTNIKHAEHVANEFKSVVERGERWRFECVTGDMDDELRDRRLGGLESGELHGIVQVDIAGEGTDIPAAEVLMMLRLTDSEGLFLQQAGRVSRPVYAPGYDLDTREGRLDSIAASSKPYAWLIDTVGNVGKQTKDGFIEKHGTPADVRVWVLEGRVKRGKRTAAEKDEPTVAAMQCPKCYTVEPPRKVCGKCGHVFDTTKLPGQVAGKLVEITAGVSEAAKARAAQGAARTLAQLKAMGMNDKRAAHVMAAREEKDRLRNEVQALLSQVRTVNSSYAGVAIAEPQSPVWDMKPKQLRSEIDRLRSELGHIEFMGEAKPAEATA